MKKYLVLLLALMLCCVCCTAFAAEPTFEVGEDECEYAIEGASGWNTVTAFVKIVAGEDVLYNGPVKLTSDSLTAAEFTLAAIYEAGCGQDGLEAGFVNSIGDYVGGTDADGNYVYWSYSVNGKYTPHTCTDMKILEGDYILWDFVVYDAEAGFSTEAALPCGYDAPFEVGEEECEYAVEGASGWNTATVNVKIVAGEDVLYNGKVTLTSDTLAVNEATLAAVYEAGCGQDGLEAGFVNSIGDYVAGTDADGNYVYWAYTVNGKYVPFSCNEFRLLDGDYVLWEYVVYAAE